MNVQALCEKLPEDHGEILRAMLEKRPVEYKGIKYGCISAFTIRARAIATRRLEKPSIYQVELMSARQNSIAIADPKDVKILWEVTT